MLKKDGFHWDALASVAFQKLKLAITQTPVLALPDFAQPFILETDASGTVIGAILSQGKHLIAYFSKKLTPRMRKQSTYVRELYSIFEAITELPNLDITCWAQVHQKSLKLLSRPSKLLSSRFGSQVSWL